MKNGRFLMNAHGSVLIKSKENVAMFRTQNCTLVSQEIKSNLYINIYKNSEVLILKPMKDWAKF